MLLCDAAQEIGGKLYILGGGWSIRQVEQQALMAIAIKLAIGWNEANEPLEFELRLMTADGDIYDAGAGPVVIKGRTEVGRPPGLKPGTELDAALAITVGFPLAAGAYRWEFDINSKRLAEEPFLVRAPANAAR